MKIKNFLIIIMFLTLTSCNDINFYNNMAKEESSSLEDDTFSKVDPYLIQSYRVGNIIVGKSDRLNFGGGGIDNSNRLILRQELRACIEECQFVKLNVIDLVSRENEVLLSYFINDYKEGDFLKDEFKTIDSIAIRSIKFSTKEGIGIGSSFKDFMSKYRGAAEVNCPDGFDCSIVVKDKNLDNINFYFEYKKGDEILNTVYLDNHIVDKNTPVFIDSLNSHKEVDNKYARVSNIIVGPKVG